MWVNTPKKLIIIILLYFYILVTHEGIDQITTVLDVGCGPGDITNKLFIPPLQQRGATSYTSTDINVGNIEKLPLLQWENELWGSRHVWSLGVGKSKNQPLHQLKRSTLGRWHQGPSNPNPRCPTARRRTHLPPPKQQQLHLQNIHPPVKEP